MIKQLVNFCNLNDIFLRNYAQRTPPVNENKIRVYICLVKFQVTILVVNETAI